MKLKYRRLRVQFFFVLFSIMTIAAQIGIAFADQEESLDELKVLPSSTTATVNISESPPIALTAGLTSPPAASEPGSGFEALGAGVFRNDEFRTAIEDARRAGIKVEEIPGSFAATFPEANELAKVMWEGAEGCSEDHLLSCYVGRTTRNLVGLSAVARFDDNPTLGQALASGTELFGSYAGYKALILGAKTFPLILTAFQSGGGPPDGDEWKRTKGGIYVPNDSISTTSQSEKLLEEVATSRAKTSIAERTAIGALVVSVIGLAINGVSIMFGSYFGVKENIGAGNIVELAGIDTSDKCDALAWTLATNTKLNSAQRQNKKTRLLTECRKITGLDGRPTYDEKKIQELDRALLQKLREEGALNADKRAESQELYDAVMKGRSE